MGTVPELLGLGPMGKEHSSSRREGKLWLGVAKSISDRSIPRGNLHPWRCSTLDEMQLAQPGEILGSSAALNIHH